MALSKEAKDREEARIASLIAAARERLALAKQNIPPPVYPVSPPKETEKPKVFTSEQIATAAEEHLEHLHREAAKTADLDWDPEQLRAIELGLSGKSFCLIGAAGTGKTTIMREILRRMIIAGKIPPLTRSTKYLQSGQPGAVVLSFTNKAVANIRRGMSKEIACLTVHKVIEFEPHFYEVQNADGDWVKTMRFEPARDRHNPLPSSLHVIAFEESATISTDLFAQLMEAVSDPTAQFIFLGDIQQLAPIYGPAILGFKMLELPVVELTKVHRQLSDSPVLRFAWEILKGKPMEIDWIKANFDTPGKFRILAWKNKVRDYHRLRQINLFINKFLEEGEYNPLEDMILMPFNVSVGTLEVNRHIADYLGKKRNAEVHEVIAGYRKLYFAVGDKVLVNKQEAIIEKINRNAQYVGKEPLSPSTKLNRWGHYELESKADVDELAAGQMSLEEMEQMLALTMTDSGDVEEKKNQASHILHCRMLDSDEEAEVQTTGEYNECLFAYVLTVHKAQGSEWNKVILFLDSSHATMICRELLYTAVTRARESLYIFCEPDHFKKGVLTQRIKGNTLEEKAEFFKGKLEREENGK